MAKPKKLWKTLKQLGLPEKRLPCTDVCLKAEEELKFDPFTISELFKKFYSNLANDLVQKLPAAARKFDIEAVKSYYNDMFDLSHNKLNLCSHVLGVFACLCAYMLGVFACLHACMRVPCMMRAWRVYH